MIEPAPACTEECVYPWLVKMQSNLSHLARQNIHTLHIHLTDSKTMNNIVRGKFQMERLTNFRPNDIGIPSAVLWRIVSSKRITPLMNSEAPLVVKSSSR